MELSMSMNDPLVLFEHELLGPIKYLTIEELFYKLENSLECIKEKEYHAGDTGDTIYFRKKKILDKTRSEIFVYLGEISRRRIYIYMLDTNYPWWEYNIVKCCCGKILEPDDICGGSLESLYCDECCAKNKYSNEPKEKTMILHEKIITTRLWGWLIQIKNLIHKEILKIKMIKKIQLDSLRRPLLSKEINNLMDSILDSNGNKISEFKEYLSPDHYRMVRAGCDVSELDLPDKEQILQCLLKMKNKEVY